ncbi:GAF and ANTAR domain-containing protein [Nocardia transvalensis]|uniref:GAF and ANTAR domain-containing protein n=1 Tax=Nocardia transvalensis TaxID=37333 RepID=UPI001895A009|nr:GAF and ANTAR domain-containing protein [Nocardia transvalensis]MBF6327211.1 GAF and ANTAR domain-containing protein [Nocardia transvalensis]
MSAKRFEPGEFALGLWELTALVLSATSLDEALPDLADITARMLPGHPLVGITLLRGSETIVVASSGMHAALVEDIQLRADIGPCPEAMQTGQPVLISDVAAEHRWEDYPARMLEHGIRSIYSQPLTVRDSAIGAFNLYARRADAFDSAARHAITLAGSHTSTLLAAAIERSRQARLTGQLQAALASRSVIDQALGIVMGQRRCTRTAAFDILRTASQRRNVRVAELAADLIRSVTGTAPDATHFDLPDDPRRL